MKLVLCNVRLAFPNLWSPKAVQGEGEPKFSATALIDPNDKSFRVHCRENPAVRTLDAAFEAVARDKWGTKAAETLKALKAGGRLCLGNGDAKAQYQGFAGMLYVNASNAIRPPVYDRDGSELDRADGRPLPGHYVNMSIELWAQDNKFGRRINASLRSVQFVREADVFSGGGVGTSDDFADLAVSNEFDL